MRSEFPNRQRPGVRRWRDRIESLLRTLPAARRRQLAAIVAEDDEFEIACPHLARLIFQDDAGMMVFAALARSGQGSLARSVIARLREAAASMTVDERARTNRALEAIGQDPL